MRVCNVWFFYVDIDRPTLRIVWKGYGLRPHLQSDAVLPVFVFFVSGGRYLKIQWQLRGMVSSRNA